MKKYLLIFSTLMLGSSMVFGQQDKLLTHFIFDKMSINPGATGVGMPAQVCGTLIYRNQWDKVNGAPNSALFNAEANLSQYFPSAAGISFYHDAVGFARQNNVTLNYSYHLPLYDGTLGLGVALGIVSYGMSPIWITPNDPNDASLPPSTGQTGLDANFGAYYMHNDGWYAGISSTHLPATELDQLNFNTRRHYYVMGGYTLKQAFDVDELDIEGNLLMRTDFVKFSSDINVRAVWDQMFFGGLTFRPSDAVGIMAGMYWNSFTFGYSYDFTVNRLSNISVGSHELMLRYCHPLPPLPYTKARNPRYL
ncbi:MAG: PorP/SprF family type IX secretion system membrane protein [Brumimicrobium sp.]|nr:PorP/SprF family type IX secretion system membrane protein [Brumimicrobium sp.]